MFLERMNTVNKKFCSDTAFKSFRPSIVAIVKLLAEQLEATGATKRRLDFLNFMINHPIVSIHHDEILGWGSTKASGALENERDGNSTILAKFLGLFPGSSSSSTQTPSVEPKGPSWF